jgi:putative sterol carrier protein
MTEDFDTFLKVQFCEAFRPDKARGTNAAVQLNLSGDDGGNWYFVIKDKAITVEDGIKENPDLTVAADAQVFRDVFTGVMSPMAAVRKGVFKTKGNMGLAMKMMNFFKF